MDPNQTDETENDYTEGYSGDDGGAPLATPETETHEPGYDGDNEEQEEQQTPEQNPGSVATVYEAMGFEGGLITLDGQQVPLDSLDGETLAEAITDRLALERQEGYQEAIATIALDETEADMVNYWREHGSLAGFEPGVSSRVQVTTLSHDDLHRQHIRGLLGENPSEEQVTQSLEARRTSPTFAAEAEAIRTSLAHQATAQQRQEEEAHYGTYIQEITQAQATVTDKDLAGIAYTPELRAYVRQQLTERGPNGVAPFVEALADPRQLNILGAKAMLFDSVVEAFQAQQGTARVQSVDELLGLNRNQQQNLHGKAPAGSGTRAPQLNGHRMTNEEIEAI